MRLDLIVYSDILVLMLKRHFLSFMLTTAIEAWLFSESLLQGAWLMLVLATVLLSRKLIVSFLADRIAKSRA
jgi:hypothetical protein